MRPPICRPNTRQLSFMGEGHFRDHPHLLECIGGSTSISRNEDHSQYNQQR
jgi:hypothetical protein